MSQYDDLTVFSGVIPVTKLLADFAEIAMDATTKTFNKFNWINPDLKKVLKKDQEDLLKGFF